MFCEAEKGVIMGNARVGLKTRSRGSAGRQSAHILRQGERYKGSAPIVLFNPKENAFCAPKLSLSSSQRRSLQKQIQVYKSRQKKLELNSPKWHKHEAKIVELRSKLDQAGKDRKNTVHFFELELCLTKTHPASEHRHRFGGWVREWLEKEFPELTPTTGAVHLDQSSLHAHIMFEVPEGKTWHDFVIERNGDNREFPRQLTKSWHDFMKLKGVEIDELELNAGNRYDKKLHEYKAETGFDGKIGDANALPTQSHTDTEPKAKADTHSETEQKPAAQSTDQIKAVAKSTQGRASLEKALERLKKTSIDHSSTVAKNGQK